LLFSFTSGYPYTKQEYNEILKVPLNSYTTPWNFQLDAKIDKSFDIGPLELNIYLWVINLLNTQNVIQVFASGDAYDDGFLGSDEGKTKVRGLESRFGEEYAQLYTDLYRALTYDEEHFGIPRQIRLGLRLNY
jgi:hypothetical protein